MAGLGIITEQIARRRREMARALEGIGPAKRARPSARSVSLGDVADFGDNPGELRMRVCVPPGLPSGAPLVVVLHGCTQSAEGYAEGAGWIALARRYGFAVLAPEQQRANNAHLCFNWFLPGDTRRDRGEAASIRDMIGHLQRTAGIDPARTFVTGLSAGGAMSAVMLATYPELFAAGAVVAGLPYGAATTMQGALEAMRSPRPRPAPEWGYLVRRASGHKGPWPRLSVWHGGADTIVAPANAGELVKQWTDLHGLPLYPSEAETSAGWTRRVWRDAHGAPLVESNAVETLAHGLPVALDDTADAELYGTVAPFLLDAGLAATVESARFFGLVPADELPDRPALRDPVRRPAQRQSAGDPGATIEAALTRAGLLRRA